MDEQTQQLLRQLITGQRVAALGTLRQGAPYVSLLPFAPAGDFSAFYIHISTLARHTRNIEADPRVSLMIAAADDGRGNPLALPRLSITGEALPPAGADLEAARTAYLARFPQAAMTMRLADFSFYRIAPQGRSRFVAGFGQALNLAPEALRAAGERGTDAPLQGTNNE